MTSVTEDNLNSKINDGKNTIAALIRTMKCGKKIYGRQEVSNLVNDSFRKEIYKDIYNKTFDIYN